MTIENLIVRFKNENPIGGAYRIKDELRRMDIKVSEPTSKRCSAKPGSIPPADIR